jgi:hypothetical protein
MNMSRVLALLLLAAGVTASTACTSTPDDGGAVAEDDLTSFGSGTYVVDERPFGTYYASRITFSTGKKYEAEIVRSTGTTQLVAGTYLILPARPNNPNSPVESDKPTLVLEDDAGGAGVSFEFDRLAGGDLRLHHSARQHSFTMKRDPSYRAPSTDTKTIACTGALADAKLTLDQAQNRRGTLAIVRKAGAEDGPPSVTVTVTKDEGPGSPDYVYFQGTRGEQDFYVNVKKADFEKRTGGVTLHLRWAENGREWGVPLTCTYE